VVNLNFVNCCRVFVLLFKILRVTGREADHSPPSGVEVKNAWSCTSCHPYVFVAWYLVKPRDNFTSGFCGYGFDLFEQDVRN
jgi:hypothetical protein